MKSINPYLIFNGNAEKAFQFYQAVFGSQIFFTLKAKDGPQGDQLSAEDAEKILHICLPFKDDQMLMGSDVIEGMCGDGTEVSFNPGNTNFISISAEGEQEANNLFTELSKGGQVMVPLEKMFWGDLFGQFVDQFGVQWMISAPLPKS